MKLKVAIVSLLMSLQLFAVNINTANVEELTTLKGVGEKTAQLIVEYRKLQKFKSVEDIMNVKGIGPKTFEKIKDKLSI